MKKDNIVYTVIFSVVITFIFVFLLSLTYQATKGKVAKNEKLFEIKAFLNSAGYDLNTINNYEEFFNENFKEEKTNIWSTNKNGEKIIIYKFSGNGLWGTIYGVIAFNKNLDKIIGLEITSHSETPGLGGRIEEEWFKNQFKNQQINDKFKIVMGDGKGDFEPNDNSVDGITGATRTTESLQKIIVDAYEFVKSNR
ncbi:Na+-transporting NADH:ubiquinone oxidoreductase subunit C [Hypnocyclicus thermotrophus]|uniref:Na+-transporting NADH:ubiquinone oxidoreductase subunit C n=1 Tax=Hypnocyclicus thermotrophus TaxID=1627895 RepID=A0AA46E0E2_9FUSO|nr:FMN-binding protein [Hypnocyclicus thermotrophus]TDT72006.1 Na+-transporting NADH:ubiquinone oxidoreductase subunit C [Hypnocyclicus thermotrophus]